MCASTGSASDQLSFPLNSWTQCPTDPSVSAVQKVRIPLIQRGISRVALFSPATYEKNSKQLIGQYPQASISINGQDYWNTLIMNPQLALNFCKKP